MAEGKRKSKTFREFMREPTPPDPAPAADPRARFQCMAHGCPAVASIGASRDLVCRFHDGIPPTCWPQITAFLREHEAVLRMMEWGLIGDASSMPDWTAQAVERLVVLGLHDLMPAANGDQLELRSPTRWSMRLLGWLADHCHREERARRKAVVAAAMQAAGVDAVRVGDIVGRYVPAKP